MPTSRPARVLSLGVVLLTFVSLLAGCEYPPNTRYVHRVFADVDTTLDVVYRSTTTSDGAPIDLKLDIYQPAGDVAVKRPAVIWMFGGAFAFGDKADMAPYAIDSAKRGYVGVSVQYRTRPGGVFSDPVGPVFDAYDDAIAAAQWLKANAATYRIDPDVIAAGGWSAGGITAWHMGIFPGRWGPATSPIVAVLAIAAAPTAKSKAGAPPVLAFSGTEDHTVLHSAVQLACDQAISVGDSCQLVSYEGENHYIVDSQMADIQARSARFLKDKVLRSRGY